MKKNSMTLDIEIVQNDELNNSTLGVNMNVKRKKKNKKLI